MNTLVAIPTHNEEKTIALVVNRAKAVCDYDILIYDDGSNDNTVKSVGACYPSTGSGQVGMPLQNIFIRRHKKQMGYGKTVTDIFKYAVKNNYTYLIKMDADLQHEAKYIKNFIKNIKHYDIVSGSRYHKNSPVLSRAPRERHNINKIITKTINKITGYNLTDSFCGFKAYKVSALKKLKLTEAGYGFPMEFLLQAHKNKLKLKEIPISLIYINSRRDFTGKIKDSDYRLKYYMGIINRVIGDKS